MKTNRQRQAKKIRTFRKVHRTTGIFLFVFFFFISISGILLGWKQHSGDLIRPKTYKGSTNDFQKWLPLDELHLIANHILVDSISSQLSVVLDRIDVRKDKGTAKFIYKDHFYEIQLDGSNGHLLNLGKRHSDLIENIHDGSILDNYMGSDNQVIKLIYASTMGTALLLFTVTGFWLWYGPKRMKKY